ncbi:MAG: nucleotidyl transferase AbiEii/AbiGii toxin family protein [Bacteroidetes bacterium]|nr:nucleotidyl transferase AbiEii/AbiGii toxin family protein [Bacteroidota bacterium]MBK8342587.1 nucleotidyl transferase AbiEii/AbiGii toxin family protein [Bacteroidota bacterium]
MSHHTNTIRIKAVAKALDDLNKKIVFVGGATISLYPDRQVFEVRPTDDVDVIIEILNYQNRTELEEKLRNIGFAPDIESGVICRYKIHGIIVDIIPTNDSSVGFNNKWYPDGFNQAVDYQIDEQCTIKILSAPYFLATKFEAFKGRGNNDGRMSQDFEDIIYVLENRATIWEEIINSNEEVKNYLRDEFRNLLLNPNHSEWIDAHVERGFPPATVAILEELKKIAM